LLFVLADTLQGKCSAHDALTQGPKRSLVSDTGPVFNGEVGVPAAEYREGEVGIEQTLQEQLADEPAVTDVGERCDGPQRNVEESVIVVDPPSSMK
jgi:hypothetical protein